MTAEHLASPYPSEEDGYEGRKVNTLHTAAMHEYYADTIVAIEDDNAKTHEELEVFADTTEWKGETSSLSSLSALRQYSLEAARTPLLNAEEEVELSKDIEAGLYAQYKLRLADERGEELSQQTRKDLLDMVTWGEQAKDRFIRANLRFVIATARKSYKRGLPLLDVIQDGNIGLIRAVEKFDYTKGFKFDTYAVAWILQAVGRSAKAAERIIRIPIDELEKIIKVDQTSKKLYQRLGREPKPKELAEELDITEEKLRVFQMQMRHTLSLEMPLSEENNFTLADALTDTLPHQDKEDAIDTLVEKSVYEGVRRAVQLLSHDEQMVLALKYGEDALSVKAISEWLSVGPGKVASTLNSAIAKLSHPSVGLVSGGDYDAESWRLTASCRRYGPEKFFPRSNEQTTTPTDVCAACPVQQDCLQFAQKRLIYKGTWGGMLANQRKRLAQKSQAVGTTPQDKE